MPIIVPTYAYASGAFDVDGHNTNLYSGTTTEGVYSEANGYLGAANLDPAFEIEDYHVWPEEAIRVRSEYTNIAVDYMSDKETGADVAEDNVREELVNVAGCGLRFYVPYNCDILWTVGFFVTIWRPHFGTLAQEDTTDVLLGDVRLQLSMDLPAGSAESSGTLTHTKRGLPASVQVDSDTNRMKQREDVACFYINLHHLTRDVTPGWADIHLRLLLRNPSTPYTADLITLVPKKRSGFKELAVNHEFSIRTTFGTRNPVGLILG